MVQMNLNDFQVSSYRSSRSEVFCKKECEACNFIKKETPAQVFSCEFCEIFKNTFFYRTPPVTASISTSSKSTIKTIAS